MIKEQVTSVHFTVHGDFLTRHVRDLMREGNWMHALKTLSDGLVGITLEQCIEILEAKAKLEGVNEVEMLPEDPENPEVIKYLEDLDWVYGCICRAPAFAKFDYYRPYAFVTNFGPHDLNADFGICVNKPSTSRVANAKSLNRASFYLNDRLHDMTYYSSSKHKSMDGYQDALAFLLEPVRNPPFWRCTNRTIDEALANTIRFKKSLASFGAKQSGLQNCDHCLSASMDEEDRKEYTEVVSTERSIVSMFADSMDIPEETIASILGEGAENFNVKQEPDQTCKSPSGYILRDGSFFGCGYMQHPLLAEALFKYTLGETNFDEWDIQKVADKHGWLRVQRNAQGTQTNFLMGYNDKGRQKEVTRAQLNTLVTYCDRHKAIFPQDLLSDV